MSVSKSKKQSPPEAATSEVVTTSEAATTGNEDVMQESPVALRELPQQPERKEDTQLDELGFQAEEFQRSPEHAYLEGLLERMIHARQWDKLNLAAGQSDELRRLCGEIELLREVKTAIIRDINMGRAAREREAKRLGA